MHRRWTLVSQVRWGAGPPLELAVSLRSATAAATSSQDTPRRFRVSPSPVSAPHLAGLDAVVPQGPGQRSRLHPGARLCATVDGSDEPIVAGAHMYRFTAWQL